MSGKRIRALCQAAWTEVDCAMNDLVWRDNPDVFESLKNAKELIEVVMEDFSDEDPEELNFDE